MLYWRVTTGGQTGRENSEETHAKALLLHWRQREEKNRTGVRQKRYLWRRERRHNSWRSDAEGQARETTDERKQEQERLDWRDGRERSSPSRSSSTQGIEPDSRAEVYIQRPTDTQETAVYPRTYLRAFIYVVGLKTLLPLFQRERKTAAPQAKEKFAEKRLFSSI